MCVCYCGSKRILGFSYFPDLVQLPREVPGADGVSTISKKFFFVRIKRVFLFSIQDLPEPHPCPRAEAGGQGEVQAAPRFLGQAG